MISRLPDFPTPRVWEFGKSNRPWIVLLERENHVAGHLDRVPALSPYRFPGSPHPLERKIGEHLG